jgi:hypothetical protein
MSGNAVDPNLDPCPKLKEKKKTFYVLLRGQYGSLELGESPL